MPAAYSLDLRERVIETVEAGNSAATPPPFLRSSSAQSFGRRNASPKPASKRHSQVAVTKNRSMWKLIEPVCCPSSQRSPI